MNQNQFKSILLLGFAIGLISGLSGCSLTGFGVGKLLDHEKPALSQPAGVIGSLEFGARVKIVLKDGRKLNGNYKGFEPLTGVEYAERYGEILEQNQEILNLPSLEDSVTVLASLGGSKRQIECLFQGFSFFFIQNNLVPIVKIEPLAQDMQNERIPELNYQRFILPVKGDSITVHLSTDPQLQPIECIYEGFSYETLDNVKIYYLKIKPFDNKIDEDIFLLEIEKIVDRKGGEYRSDFFRDLLNSAGFELLNFNELPGLSWEKRATLELHLQKVDRIIDFNRLELSGDVMKKLVYAGGIDHLVQVVLQSEAGIVKIPFDEIDQVVSGWKRTNYGSQGFWAGLTVDFILIISGLSSILITLSR